MICRVALSITLTVPPISAETQTSASSLVHSAKRGRWSTRTLSVISCVSVSMKCAMLVVSDVLTTHLPSWLTPMPSGSTPTGISDSIWPLAMSTTVTMLSSSLATNISEPSGARSISSGSGPDGSLPMIWWVVVSMTSIVSSSEAQM